MLVTAFLAANIAVGTPNLEACSCSTETKKNQTNKTKQKKQHKKTQNKPQSRKLSAQEKKKGFEHMAMKTEAQSLQVLTAQMLFVANHFYFHVSFLYCTKNRGRTTRGRGGVSSLSRFLYFSLVGLTVTLSSNQNI